MSPIAQMTLVFAAACALLHGLLLARPHQVRIALNRFPRDRLAGRLLTAAALFWTVLLLYHTDFGGFNWLKHLPIRYVPWLEALTGTPFAFLQHTVVWAGALAYILIVKYMDELLAPRALGGLLLLIPSPLLDAARWLDTNWRWIIALVAYALVIQGIVLVLSPYRFRQVANWLVNNPRHRILTARAGLASSALLFVLALWKY